MSGPSRQDSLQTVSLPSSQEVVAVKDQTCTAARCRQADSLPCKLARAIVALLCMYTYEPNGLRETGSG